MKRSAVAVFCALALLSTTARSATYELVPKVGYQINMSRSLSGPTDTSLDFDNEPVVGLSLGYLTKDNGELEISWTHSNTTARVEQVGGAPTVHFDADIDQFHLNGLYLLSDTAFQPFALLGLGATHYSASGNRSDNTKFSLAAGGGLKWLWNDHFGLRFDALWTPTLAPQGADFFCTPSGACQNIESNSLFSKRYPFMNSLLFTTGLLLRY